VRLSGPASYILTLSLTACGVPAVQVFDDPDSGSNLQNGGTGGGAGEMPTPDAGGLCECATGWVCIPSTGGCVRDEPVTTEEPDAGLSPPCTDGDVVSCGVSKLGECQLGTATCAGGRYGACMGNVDPVAELCNGRDDDCDGLVDDALPDSTCGLGECRRTQASCIAGVPHACTPGAPAAETCNGLDDDCNGTPDDNLMSLSCGTGACARSVASCAMGQANTCTPGTPSAEVCNGSDDDCDGQTDESLGSSTCGTGACQRTVQNCVGGAPQSCTPGTPGTETCNDADDDCDGQTDEGLGSLTCGMGACARSVPACAGGAPQSCTPGTPGAETCNGVDDDCDGQTDESLPVLTCGLGACLRMTPSCAMGMPLTCVPGMAVPELCNGADDDCDGQTDEALGSTTCGTGACQRTVQNCDNGAPQMCLAGSPATETCNNTDDDCDGQTDEGLGNLNCGVGACARSVPACTGGVAGSCTPGSPGTETCNGIDDDCDGTIDDGVCAPVAMCPAGSTVNANTTVNLTTSASSPQGRPITCAWTVVSRPASSSGTFSAPSSCGSSTYFADVVGSHVLQFTVTDSLGVSSSCQVTITVNPIGDLWIELTWDRNNDMDLHLQHPSAGNSHNANSWGFSALGYDCYYGDTNPAWDNAGVADDPSLDRDDISGRGPENIRINTPRTNHDYIVGVHMYSWAASPQAVNATVKVYCSGVLATTRSLSFNVSKRMWVVGNIRFASNGTCTFTPDGFTFNLP